MARSTWPHAGVLQENIKRLPKALTPETQRLQSHVHAALVAVAEAVDEGLLWTGDADLCTVGFVRLDAFVERWPREPEERFGGQLMRGGTVLWRRARRPRRYASRRASSGGCRGARLGPCGGRRHAGRTARLHVQRPGRSWRHKLFKLSTSEGTLSSRFSAEGDGRARMLHPPPQRVLATTSPPHRKQSLAARRVLHNIARVPAHRRTPGKPL